MYLSAQFARPAVSPYFGLATGRYLSGAGSSKAKRASRTLAAITPDAATEQIFPQAQVRGRAGHNAATRQEILYSAQAGQVMTGDNAALAYSGPQYGCAGVSLLK